MDARRESELAPVKNRTTVERKSERELVTTRTFNGPARIVFQAWTTPELFQRWWVPKSFGLTLLSCELDVRVGGRYRLMFSHPAAPEPVAFFGTYLEVTPPSRLVWTNEEGGESGQVTTVTFEERGGQTLQVVHELYPSKEALDEAIASGATCELPEQFEALDELLVSLGASEGDSSSRNRSSATTGRRGRVHPTHAACYRWTSCRLSGRICTVDSNAGSSSRTSWLI